MYRYFILVWEPRDAQSAAVVKELARRLQSDSLAWSCILERSQSGLQVHHAGAHASSDDGDVLADGTGAVLGTLFPAVSGVVPTPMKLSRRATAAAVVSVTDGRHLVDCHWGRYVAVLQSPAGHVTRIIRDPSGGMPCFCVTHCGVHIFFSDMEDLLRLEPLQFSVNWPFVAATVASAMLPLRETGLTEVSEVLPGECVVVRGDALQRLIYWDPWSIARTDNREDADEAARELRAVTRACVHAWAARHRRIVHRLSGGLDSSIVLSCLSDASTRPSITCINYFSDAAEEDERPFARLAAQRADCELIECRREVQSIRLERLLNVARSPRPWFYLYCVEHGHRETALAREKGATALFGGLAGDALFYQARAHLAAADYARMRGLRPQLMKVVLDAARIERVSIWAILRRALASRILGDPFDPLAEAARCAAAVPSRSVTSAERARRLMHPWLQSPTGAPPGKSWHVMSMASLPPYYDPLGSPDDPESVYPLISQPLIELCLRIPTYVLIAGGWDRALARRAFVRDVPPQIIRRRDKGASTEHTRRIFEANTQLIREMLLDGVLVKEGILDRRQIEQSLDPARSFVDSAFARILIQHLSVEAWLGRWCEWSRKHASRGGAAVA